MEREREVKEMLPIMLRYAEIATYTLLTFMVVMKLQSLE